MGYGCREFFLFSASNPNSDIRADLCIVILVRLERIMDAGVDFLNFILLFASIHVCGIVGLQAACDRSYAYSYARLVPQLTYDLHRTSGFAGASFSSLVDMRFLQWRPLTGFKKQLANHRCGCMLIG
jgi:hypothetical protein